MSKSSKPTVISPACPECHGGTFEIRALKDEGLASAKCLKCARDYLVLDSQEYWFDIIQNGYPRRHRCSCKSTSFGMRFDYFYRNDVDVKNIDVYSTCAGCQKTKVLMSLDIKYSPTNQLIETPLVYCKNQKILYDLKELNLFITKNDLAWIAEYLSKTAHCTFTAQLHRENKWVRTALRDDEFSNVILNGTYFYIYAVQSPLTVPEPSIETSRLKVENLFWKRQEIVRLSSPTNYCMGSEMGLLFYVSFSNEFIDGDTVVSKSAQFRGMTKDFVDWLRTKFVSWRGVNCFDNREEHLRMFGTRFHKG